MSLRRDDIDLSAQEQALADARAKLAAVLTDLSVEAKKAAKTAATKRGTPDLPKIYALTRAVQSAEEQIDFAALDLHSASGHDV